MYEKHSNRGMKETIFLLAMWLWLGMLTFIPNNGGSGLALPGNGLAWGVMAVITLWLTVKLPAHCWFFPRFRRWPVEHYLLIAGLIIWSLPILWTPLAQARVESMPHVVALWLLIGFLGVLRRLPTNNNTTRLWLMVIWLGGLFQSVYALLQVATLSWTPLHGLRPYGFFQQTNVLASFIATGLVCLLYSWLYSATFKRIFFWLACAGFVTMPFVLVLLQSRVGYLGAGCGSAILITRSLFKPFQRQIMHKKWLVLLLMAIGALAAFVWQHGYLEMLFPGYFSVPVNFNVVNKSHSTLNRIMIMQTTMHMIAHHPWLGVGYGLFEGEFARQIIADGHYWDEITLIHPHNELLYAWSEGGIIALLGLLLMVSSVLIKLFRRRGLGICGVALLLPLALHLNFEYPLYQSVTHGMLLVILIYLTTPGYSSTENRVNYSISLSRVLFINNSIRLLYITVGVFVLIYSLTAIQTGMVLTRVERQSLIPLALNPRAVIGPLYNVHGQSERIDFDSHVALLMRYNFTKDVSLLSQFYNWSTGFMYLHNNPNVTASRLMVIKAIYPEKFQAACRVAHRQWIEDERFLCR